MAVAEDKNIEEELWLPILLAERISKAVEEADSFKFHCSEVNKQVDRISQTVRPAIRYANANRSLYEHPVRRIVTDVSKNLERALILVRRCKRSGIISRIVTITTTTDFRRLFNLLDASLGNMKWLLSIFDSVTSGCGIALSLPPIAINDPTLSWVWSFIAVIQMGRLPDSVEAANELASFALDNDRNKKIILEEGGVPPLLKLLKEGASPDVQIAAANVLLNLANDQERVRFIVAELGIPVIVQVLCHSSMGVQIWAANLVSRMAEHDPVAQEEFARENAIRPLVSLLSFEIFVDNPKPKCIPSIIQIDNKQRHLGDSSRGGKERENEDPEVKLKLKMSCVEALRTLSKGSVSNSRNITETKGLVCLAKLVEKEQGELQLNCLMTIMEITATAEANNDLKQAAFKNNSPVAKAVVEQLLRIIQTEESSPLLQISAIKSMGYLARIFTARETTRIIGPLVIQLGNRNPDVATEAAIALGKFACPENYLCVEHSKAIIEFDGVPSLLTLLRANERAQLHGLTLLHYLALHVASTEGNMFHGHSKFLLERIDLQGPP